MSRILVCWKSLEIISRFCDTLSAIGCIRISLHYRTSKMNEGEDLTQFSYRSYTKVLVYNEGEIMERELPSSSDRDRDRLSVTERERERERERESYKRH